MRADGSVIVEKLVSLNFEQTRTRLVHAERDALLACMRRYYVVTDIETWHLLRASCEQLLKERHVHIKEATAKFMTANQPKHHSIEQLMGLPPSDEGAAAGPTIACNPPTANAHKKPSVVSRQHTMSKKGFNVAIAHHSQSRGSEEEHAGSQRKLKAASRHSKSSSSKKVFSAPTARERWASAAAKVFGALRSQAEARARWKAELDERDEVGAA
jgi:hypothetical protein